MSHSTVYILWHSAGLLRTCSENFVDFLSILYKNLESKYLQLKNGNDFLLRSFALDTKFTPINFNYFYKSHKYVEIIQC